LYNGEKNTLTVAAQIGYPDEFVRLYKELSIDDDIACGRAVRLKKRIVIEDAYEDEGYKPFLYFVNAGGFRGVQSTPLFDYDGNLMGVLSTHFKEKYVPVEEDLWTLDLYSRQIASFISRNKAEEALRRSEERLRSTVEAAIDYAIITTDTNGMVEGWNSGAEHIFEYSAEEVMGRSADLIFTEEDRANKIPEKEMATAREKGMASDERWHQRKDGSRFFMIGTMRPVYNPQLAGYVKVARDMTGQKKNEENLKIAEERYRIALQSANMAAWDWNIKENRIIWNEQHHLLLGLEPTNQYKDVNYFLQFVHVDDKERIVDELKKAVEETCIYKAEFRIVRADNNQVCWMSGFGRVVNRENKRATRMVGVMFDITERKKLEQQKDDFISIASHELKTPVTSIKGYTEMLREMYDKANDTDDAQLVVKLDEQVDRLIDLIRSLLDTARISQEGFVLHPENFSIDELIKERIDELKHITKNHTLKHVSGGNVFVTADKKRISEVLTNFISNAIKYSPKGGDIIIRQTQTEQGVQVSVHDNGIGIPDEVQGRIFERFFRVQEAQVNTYPGLGLGLYISASIIQQHKGKIWLESKLNEGSTFYFTLPRKIKNKDFSHYIA
jgi:PAS domain S-box-containing protein